MRERRRRRFPLIASGRGMRQIVTLAVVAILLGACSTQLDGSPTPTPGPRVLGIDWARSKPVERPAEAFDVPSDRPFSTGLGNSGHQLNFPGQAIMSDVVRTAEGYVAIGYVYPGWHPVAWTSPDAETWSLRRMEATDFTFPTAAAVGANGTIVAVGRSGQAARTWTSADGASWTLHDVPRLDPSVAERMLTVIATPDGFLAGGSSGAENFDRHARLWTSTDGASWVPVPDDGAAFANAEVRSLIRGSSGYVAVGWVGPARAVTGSVAWTSVDGRTWTRVESPAFAGSQVAAVSQAPFGGLVAVGTDLGDNEARVWLSPDGRDWTLVPGEASRKHDWKTRMTDVTSVGNELIAVGNFLGFQYGTATSWTSTDGIHWTQSRSAPVQEQGEFYAVIPGGPGVVAVGSFGAPDNYVPTVWLSPPQ